MPEGIHLPTIALASAARGNSQVVSARVAYEDGSGALSAVGAASRRRARSLSLAPASVSIGDPNVFGAIDEELARLREEVHEQAERCRQTTEALAAARVTEKRERKDLLNSRTVHKETTKKLVCRIQKSIRGWLVRRRIFTVMHREHAIQMGMAAMLPDQLREQLVDLQHNVHDLKYLPDHQHSAAVKVQTIWRGIFARRAVRVLRISCVMEQLYRRMDAAATKIVAWYRMQCVRLKYEERCRRIQQDVAYQAAKMEATLRIQCSIRARQARSRVRDERRLFREMQARQMELESLLPQVLVDSWRPGGLAGDPLGDEAAGVAAALVAAGAEGEVSCGERSASPSSDREIQRLEDEGLEPFYWSSAQELVRHRVGGPQALKMQRYLGLGDPDWSPPAGDEIDSLCGLWDVYPEGLSADFLDNLDADAWPWQRKASAKKKRKAAALKDAQKGARPCKAPPPPTNAERRAEARQEAPARLRAAASERNSLEQQDAHPLFLNAPPLQALPAPPTAPPPRGRPRARLAARSAHEEDVSWGNAKGFSHCPRGDETPTPQRRNRERLAAMMAPTWQHPMLALEA